MTDVGCNYFPKEEMWTSSDVVGRHRFDFSVPAAISERQQNRKSTGKLRSRIRRMPVHHLLWIGNKTPQLHIPPSVRDGDKISKCGQSNSLMSKLFLSDHRNDYVKKRSQFSETFSTREQVVEEPWLLQSSVVSLLAADFDNLREVDNERDSREYFESDLGNSNFLNASKFNEGFSSDPGCDVIEMKDACVQFDPSLTNYPVEEPWLVDSSISTDLSDVKIAADRFSNEPIEDQATQSAHHDQDMPSENLLHEEESNVMTEEDSVSTVILINSSLCTVQRIAVLENDKLVELLLEPVKNNVQCDSVYLGVVSKLVPHMGGAFVNIGSPRPSFMDIKCYREPFILPPFHDYVKEREACDTPYHENPGEQLDFPENGSLFEKAEELDDVDDGQSEDEFIDDEFGSHENGFHFDVSEINKGNVNGSVSGHEREDDGERYAEQLNGDLEQFQPENMNYDGADIKGTEESKWAHVQKGSKIIVQVIKEGLGTKGPTLTAYPKLRSRFWVLSTRSKTIGISKKISGVERTRLRVIAKTLQPPGFGLTVRTVASGHSLEELQKDLEGLLSTWKSIVEHAKSAALAADEGVDAAVPVMLHRAMGQTLSVVQDYFNEKVRSMVVDSPRTYHEVSNYLQEIAPDLCERVELYSKRTPLFDEYNIEGEINNILSKRVPLDNGGYLVIEQTEALVSIDVNGGHWMLGQGTSQEKAVLEVNLAAARQIARELRLRDIGGIIVVDFIDMLDDSNKRLVYEEVKRAVNRDRSTVKVSELSRHGLMEITRKRVRPSVTFMISEPCPCCHATGRVEALETSFSKIEHEICRLLSMMDQKADPGNPKSWPRFILRVDRHMCNYLTSGKRTRLATLSSSLKVWILLKVARGLTRGTFELKTLTDENMHRDQRQAAIPVFRPKEVVTYAPSRKVMLFPIKKWKTGGK